MTDPELPAGAPPHPRLPTADGGSGYRLELDLRGRSVLVAGGGPAAARHAVNCARAGARVRVLAPEGCEDLATLAEAGTVPGPGSGTVHWEPRAALAADLTGCALVHAATGSRAEDATIATWAAAAGIWCVADSAPAAGSARRPARVRRPEPGGQGRVALVGGGPGDPELITARGLALLHQADVVVVDRLAPQQLLAVLDPDVQVIDVGKTPDHHPVPQQEINRLLVAQARAGRRVVRLKGGDPYLLGRGGEEAQACREAGIPVLVVPGVTSALAVPAAAGIPVTHRGLARSVTVLTGHDDPDHAALVRLGGTIVVLMGVARLQRLCTGLLGHGMDPRTPVAMIERGWSPRQRTTRTELAEAVRAAEQRGVRSPAVIVIGAVAALTDELPHAVPDELPQGVPDELTHAVPDELTHTVRDELPHAVPDGLPHAVRDELSPNRPDGPSPSSPDGPSPDSPDGPSPSPPGRAGHRDG